MDARHSAQGPGAFVLVTGQRVNQPDQVVFLALAHDEATYRNLAAMPEQHQFSLRWSEVFSDELT